MNASQSKPAAKRNKRALIVGIFVALMIGLVALNMRGNATFNTADPSNTEQVVQGRQLYAANCASCHGANLEGQPNWQQDLPGGGRPAPPHDATGHTWHHSDQSLFTTVKQGGQATSPPGYKSTMPAFGAALSDTEIWAVLAFIKSTWPPDVQAAQRQAGHE